MARLTRIEKMELELARSVESVNSLEERVVKVDGAEASSLGGSLVAERAKRDFLQEQLDRERVKVQAELSELERQRRIAKMTDDMECLRTRWAEWQEMYLELTDAVNLLWSEYKAIRAIQGQLSRLAGQDNFHLDTNLRYDAQVDALRTRRNAPLKWEG